MPRYSQGAGVRPVFSLLLCVLMGLPRCGLAQAGQEAPAPAKLNIVIVEGDGAINNVKQRTAREAIVQVEDENRRPIAGAAVLFMLPDSGPGGVFSNGTRTLQVMTDSQGRAAVKGLRVNSTQGKFQIQVQATYQGVTATATITQTNAVITAAAVGGISGKLIAILAIAGGAAAGGAYALTRSNGGSTTMPPTTPTTISAGAPSVGGPQ